MVRKRTLALVESLLSGTPRLELERDALRVDDNHGFVEVLFSFVPKEVLVGLLEQMINDALSNRFSGAVQLAWDVPLKQAARASAGEVLLGQFPSTLAALRSVASSAAAAARTAAAESALAAHRVQAATGNLGASLRGAAEEHAHRAAIAAAHFLDDDLLIGDDASEVVGDDERGEANSDETDKDDHLHPPPPLQDVSKETHDDHDSNTTRDESSSHENPPSSLDTEDEYPTAQDDPNATDLSTSLYSQMESTPP